MKYREFVAMHVQFLKDNPDAGDMVAVAAADQEGNAFFHAVYGPVKGLYEGNPHAGDFTQEGEDPEFDGFDKPNAVCVS